jgi:hypothetical protein
MGEHLTDLELHEEVVCAARNLEEIDVSIVGQLIDIRRGK